MYGQHSKLQDIQEDFSLVITGNHVTYATASDPRQRTILQFNCVYDSANKSAQMNLS